MFPLLYVRYVNTVNKEAEGNYSYSTLATPTDEISLFLKLPDAV